MSKGFLRIPREFFESALWQEDRALSRAEAWLDLYQSATYVPRQHCVEGRCLSLARGELVASVRYLSHRWKWSRGKVERYLKQLKRAPMRKLETRTETGITVISLLNYDTYDPPSHSNETPARPRPRHPRDKIEERKERKNSLPSGSSESESVSNLVSLPTLEQWHAYAAPQPGYNPAELARLYHHYNAIGWTVGGKTVHRWQSLVDAKLAGLAPPSAAKTAAVPETPPEPQGWQTRLLALYPKSDPDGFTWAEFHKKYPDIAQQLQPKKDQA